MYLILTSKQKTVDMRPKLESTVSFFSKVSFCHHGVLLLDFSFLLVSVHASRLERIISEFFNGVNFAQG